MTEARGWGDQPEKVKDGRIVFRAHFNHRITEVRDHGRGWYTVTVGNLFGSQTVECASAEVVFEVMHQIANRNEDEHDMTLPLGAEILPNAE